MQLKEVQATIMQLYKKNEELATPHEDQTSDFVLTPNSFIKKSRNSFQLKQDRSDQTPFDKIKSDTDFP